MNADQEIERKERASLAVGARQYVKHLAEKSIEEKLAGLESHLGGKEIDAERVFVTLGGIMAMRALIRAVDREIRVGQEPVRTPSPQGTA